MQTRREFLKNAGAGAAALVGASLLPQRTLADDRDKQKQPNILIIMCDQLTAAVLSCYGGPVPTPSIDRIAREGVLFNQATCPTPFCSPSRASMITGLYPHTHGIVLNVRRRSPRAKVSQDGITRNDVTTEKLLYESGYATHHYGKWHLQGEALPYYTDMYTPHTYSREMAQAFEEVRKGDRAGWMKFYAWALPVEVAPPLQKAVEALGDRWKDQRYADFITKMGRLKWPPENHFDVRVADRTVKRIAALERKPFMVTCSFIVPHDPNVVHSPYYEAFDPDSLKLPENWRSREKRFEKQWSRRIVADLGEPGLREFLRIYYGMVKMIDDQVGRILKALDDAGQTDDTIIVFTTDHGDMAGGHGMVWKSTDAFYDEVARIPLLLRYPRRLKPQRTEMAACLTNVMPTLLDLLGKPIPEHVQGQSLLPHLTGQRDAAEAPVFSFSERVGRNPQGLRKVTPGTRGSFMIRGKGWKYIRYRQGDEYLYHLAEDPGETTNLITDRKYRPRRNDLAAELDVWLRRTRYPSQA